MAHDFLGSELSIGDDVVFLNYNVTSASLARGKVTKVSEHTAEISGIRRAEYKIIKVNPVKPTMNNTWIPCSERLPEPETEVLVVCRRGGVSFVCPAMYEDGKMLRGESIWNWNEIDGYGLYNEDADDWFIPEGWWEYRQFNDDDVYNNLIDCAVTNWMPMPEPPEEKQNGRT